MGGRSDRAASPAAWPVPAGTWRDSARSMAAEIAIYGAYFVQFLKARMAYRTDFVIDLTASVLSLGAQLTVLAVLFRQVTALRGWTFDEVLLIYGFSLLPSGLFNLVSVNIYRFSERYLVEGELDRVLLRPVDPLGQILFGSFGINGVNELVLGIAVTAAAVRRLGLHPGPGDWLWLAVLALSGALVYVGVFLALASVSFRWEDRMGLMPPVYNVIRFSRYPLTIYGRPVRWLLTFLLPFGWVAFYPANWLLRHPPWDRWAVWTPLVGAVVFWSARRLWLAGVRRYGSTGT